MRLNRCSTFLAVLFLGCGGPPEALPDPTAEPTPDEPDAAAIDAAMADLELGSSVEDGAVEDATPGAFAMLTQGTSAAKKPKAKAKAKAKTAQSSTDPGLGGTGGRTLTGEQVQEGIRPNLPQVRACYEKELKKGGDFGGKVIVAWTIGADGKVRDARVIRNSTGNRAMLPCITRVVSRWGFAKAESPTDIEYPFRFKPSFGF